LGIVGERGFGRHGLHYLLRGQEREGKKGCW
jgi:hypothetical protein